MKQEWSLVLQRVMFVDDNKMKEKLRNVNSSKALREPKEVIFIN
jgi:hypothetical protein